MTDKGQHALDLIKEQAIGRTFSAKELSELCGEKIAPASLSALARGGYLEAFDTAPKTYRLVGEGEDTTISTAVVDNASLGQAALTNLLNARNRIETSLNAILHWMNSETYAEDPGSQKGIYRIVAKTGSRAGKVLYIGQTGGKGEGQATFASRWKEHQDQLLKGTHHCAELQKYFDTEAEHNLDNLSFEIQQELPSDEQLIDLRERYWIDFFDNDQNNGKLCNTLHPSLESAANITITEDERKLIKKDIESKRIVGVEKLTRGIAAAIHDYLYSAIKLSDQDKISLITAIIIALNDENFRGQDDKLCTDGSYFVKNFMNSLECSIQRYPGLKSGRHAMYETFSFIEANENFKKIIQINGQSRCVLQLLTETIRKSICRVAKELPNYDVMGDFYNEFTSYSGADQSSLGIVLTPHHVANFMATLLDIQPNDVVLDTCCGTSALLLATDNRTDKHNHLLGVEYNARMAAISLANFILHGSNATLWNGDSWSTDILEKIKQEKPTKLIINPPYAQDGFPELGFIQRGLDALQPGGMAAVIVPKSVGLKMTKEYVTYREDILQHHTLLATFSMPKDLFENVGVHTFILLFKAGEPQGNKETFAGDLSEDGFERVKNAGRQDTKGKWHSIEVEMLNAYANRTQLSEKTTCFVPTAKNEWLVESYLKVDYTKLTQEDFIKTLRNYNFFKILKNIKE